MAAIHTTSRDIKVPAVTLGFWIIEILATTPGETGEDSATMTLNWGYLAGTALCLVALVALVAMQIRAQAFNPVLYWLTIGVSNTFGTTTADFADRSLGIGYPGGAFLLLVLLLGALGIWYRSGSTIDVDTVSSPRVGAFYWVSIGLEILPFNRDVFRSLAEGDLDMALYADDPILDNLHTSDLFVEAYVYVARANHPIVQRAKHGRVALKDYLAQVHILVTVSGGRSGVVDETLRRLGRSRRIALCLPYFMTAALIVTSSDLVLTLLRRVVGAAGAKLRLITLRPPIELERIDYRLIWHKRTHRDPGCARPCNPHHVLDDIVLAGPLPRCLMRLTARRTRAV